MNEDRRGRRPWRAVVLFAATMLVAFFDRHLLVLLITPMKRSLHLSDTQVGLLVGAVFTLLYLLVGIPLARLVDRGRRTGLLACGIMLCSAGTAALGLAHGFVMIAGARMAQGVGSSVNAPAITAMLGDMFPRDRLARPIAIVSIGGAVGSALALMLGGWLLGWIEGGHALTLPGIGTPEPWQLVMLAAAVPGPIVALLILTTIGEPPRRARPGDAATATLRDVLRHLARHRAAYLPIVLATGVNSTLVLGLLVWSPSLFERKFGWAVGEPGPYLGAILLVVAPIGLLCGGWLADRRAARGDALANMRIVAWACGGLAPLAIAYPLLPGATSTLAVLALALFFAMVALGPANAAVQRITPDRMRGTVTAIQATAVNILGFGLGPLLVALLTDEVFLSEARLASAMALFAAILAPPGIALNLLALRPYARSASIEVLAK